MASWQPARSAASVGASVRMSLTTTSRPHVARAAAPARAPPRPPTASPPSPAGGGKRLVLLGGRERAAPRPRPARASCSQVSTTTSWPRAGSARASPIAGNACPASPNAATSNRTAHAVQDPVPAGVFCPRKPSTSQPMSRCKSSGTPSSSPPAYRRRPPAAHGPGGDAPRHRREPDHRRRLRRSRLRRRLPDARRAPKRRPHRRRQLRPRLGRVHRRPPAAPRNPPRGPHPSRAARDESLELRHLEDQSIAELAAQIRAEREAFRCAEVADAPHRRRAGRRRDPRSPPRATGERHRAAELRTAPLLVLAAPGPPLDDFKDLLAAAEEQLTEQRASELSATRRSPREPGRRR